MAVDCFPLAKGTYWRSSPYGPRSTGMHRGVDYAANNGTPLYAPEAGRITIPAYEANGAGNNIWIANGNRIWKMFHLSRIDVRNGQYVQAGQQVGCVGNTGRSSGPHLHIELHIGGSWNHVDPTGELNAARWWPNDTGRTTAPAPSPAPAAPRKEEWMSRTLTIRGESAQYRLVDDGFGQLRKQVIPDMPRRTVLARAELVTGDHVELTDPNEIASLRAIPDINPQTADIGALVLAANVMAEVRAAADRVLVAFATRSGPVAVAVDQDAVVEGVGTIDPKTLVDALVDELHERLES